MMFLLDSIKRIIRKTKIVKEYFNYIESIKKYKKFRKNFLTFKKEIGNSKRNFDFGWYNRYPCLDDDSDETTFDKIYLFHISWAARILSKIKPLMHIDISSSVYFSSIVSAFIPVKFYDYRPADIELDNLECLKCNLLMLPFEGNSIKSLSCMHVVEHIGLGRYGDEIDPDGDLKAINELKRVLAKGGSLIFVVPIGKTAIQFNAHRIYSYEQILSYFDGLKLKEFSLIPDLSEECNHIIKDATKELSDKQHYGCGCFWFIK